MPRFLKVIILLFSAIFVTACGGGGGGKSKSTSKVNDQPFNTQPKITASTQSSTRVVGEATRGSEASAPNKIADPQPKLSASLLAEQVSHLTALILPSQALSNVATKTEVISCDNDGDYLYFIDDSNTSGKITFNDCLISDSTYDGSIDIDLEGASFLEASALLTFNNLIIDKTQYASSINGKSYLTASRSLVSDKSDYILDGVSLIIEVAFNSETIRIGSFFIEQSHTLNDLLEPQEESDIYFEVDSSFLQGSYIVDSTESLIKTEGDDLYSAGVLLISGASNSSIKGTINGELSSDNVLIEVDADGDGVYEFSNSKTWLEIESEL